FLSAIIARIKIMSKVDIVEHRIPQDGQAIVKTKDQRLDLRVSFIPTPYGESVVIRILPTGVLYDIGNLGLDEDNKLFLLELIKKLHGIIFVTGPTGSGKTTTLYACLNRIKSGEKKIITIEDPIEYEMDGVTQIQVNPQTGLTFAAGLRSILRHDPDIIMVGEVRDRETAEIAIRVALTGHLVFSTLHTNSAATSIHRLIDIGIEPYLIYSSTNIFIAQRLVRLLCPKCKIPDKNPSPNVLQFIMSQSGISDKKEVSLYKSAGCDYCNHTGFYGRSAVYEMLPIDENIRELIQTKALPKDIEKAAISKGMKTMLQSALTKVSKGITTIDEVISVLAVEKLDLDNRTCNIPITEAPDSQASLADAGVKTEDKKTPPDEADSMKIFDRRIYPRLRTPAKIRFSFFKGISKEMQKKIVQYGVKKEDLFREYEVTIQNISAGGVMFKHELPLIKDAVLDIKLTIPAGQDTSERQISCLAKVVWSHKEDKTALHEAAICFLDLSSGDRGIVNNFVKTHSE
ncbi:MAG: Flp pilus assembly complex ATPase component TadA, partial [Candidatus Omnitrophica bacterium]|nr:Flp pilus assembly complex ATPase component TadA [Candidatus Omnitrophota bacterium]